MRIFRFDEVNSTNTYLKEMADRREFDLAITKRQSAGRGRRGNKWSSEDGAALFSIVLRDRKNLELEDAVRIPLVMGLAVLKGVEGYLDSMNASDLKSKLLFKWTNDVYFHGRKLAGILVEKVENDFIVGIGINVANKIDEEISTKAISLGEVLKTEIDIEGFIFHVVKYVKYYFEIFLNNRWDEILEEINRKNLLKDRELEIHYVNSIERGVGSDILPRGTLEVTVVSGERKELSIGEVHLKI